MRRLGLIGVLVPALAWAGWVDLPAVGGTPQDVVVADAGVVVAASSGAGGLVGAWALTDAGVVTLVQQTGNYLGAGMFAGQCVAALQTSGTVVALPAGCGGPQLVAPTVYRLRVLPGGVALVRGGSPQDSLFVAASPISTFSGLSGSFLGANPRSLAVARIGPAGFAVMNEAGASLRVSVDGGAPVQVMGLPAPARDAVPFERLGLPAAVAVTTTNVAFLQPDLGGAGGAPISLPMAYVPQFVAITTTGAGDAGAGYGLMTSTSGAVLSPVPDPSQPGSLWLPRTGAPPMFNRVHCLDARWCAGFGDGGVVHVLSNDFAPTLALDAGTLTPGVAATLTAVAADPDGDPVFITWSSGVALVTQGADPERRTATVTVPPAAECTTLTVPVTATISDGLSTHERTVVSTAALASNARAWLFPIDPTASAGDPALSFVGGNDAGCPGGTFAWSASDGQMGAGPTFSWDVPATECRADGGVFDISVSWIDPVGRQSSATSRVTVAPWGRAAAPVFPTPAVQLAGTTQVWGSPGSSHVCASAAGFPGTRLTWTLPPSPPPGVSLAEVDAGLEIAVPDVCASGTVVATAVQTVVGNFMGRASDAGTLTVTIVPNPPPLGPGTPFDAGVQVDVDGGRAFGVFSVDAGCRDLSRLSAEVTLGVPDASIVARETFAQVPGPWEMAIPASCGSGQFELIARLFDDGGATGAFVRDVVPAPSLPVLPGLPGPSTLPVVCGVGARGTLTVEEAPGGCATPVATWRQTGGPALAEAILSGTTVLVQSASLGLDPVGQVLSFDVEVGDGTGVSATASHQVRLTAEPFVEIAEAFAPFPAREEESMWVTIHLRNTTACDVTGLVLREALDGLSPVLDTLRLGVAPVTGEWADGVLTIRDLALPADTAAQVTFEARRRLLAKGGATGTVHLNDVLVSSRLPEAPPATGCGCQPAGGGAWALAGLWALALRRRRRLG